MADNTQTATKQDVLDATEVLRGEMATSTNALREEIAGEITAATSALREELTEVIGDSETKLLRAFYSFAESNQTRFGQVEANTNAVIARLATLESRVIELEKRLNMPPAAWGRADPSALRSGVV
ncbi:MAG TPA: hypothetical protein VLY04_15875 [Bryobacteraceae bacterium]|nr:hypothetical protein [Bryobacteraceae bacterium]